MVSPNFKNEALRISVSDTKHLLSGPVSLFSDAWHLAFIWWSFRPLKFLQSCPQLHDTPLILVEVLVGLSCFVPVLIPDLVLQLLILPPFRAALGASLFFVPLAIKYEWKSDLLGPSFISSEAVWIKKLVQCKIIWNTGLVLCHITYIWRHFSYMERLLISKNQWFFGNLQV